jgi:hypothetical protein
MANTIPPVLWTRLDVPDPQHDRNDRESESDDIVFSTSYCHHAETSKLVCIPSANDTDEYQRLVFQYH